jgi:hypothetical protein
MSCRREFPGAGRAGAWRLKAGLLVGDVPLEIGVGHVRQVAIDPIRHSLLFAQRHLQGRLSFLMAGFAGKLNERLIRGDLVILEREIRDRVLSRHSRLDQRMDGEIEPLHFPPE